LPPHSLHGAGKILRRGSTGCLTLGNPVPLQAEHFTSSNASSVFNLFIKYASQKAGSLPLWQSDTNTRGLSWPFNASDAETSITGIN